MTPPPLKKVKEEDTKTISMVVDKWKRGQVKQYSPVQHINGYPWRLRLQKGRHEDWLDVICDKSSESELWECNASIVADDYWGTTCKVKKIVSWDEESHSQGFTMPIYHKGKTIEVEITTKENGESWTRRPTLDPFEPRDGFLVVGKEKKKINVHKSSLAAHSPYFDRLFNADFKEKKMDEIPIGNVEYEEFANLLKIVYGFDGASITDENVDRIVQLADRFELKIVEDRAVNYLLSSASSMTIHQKLLLSEDLDIPFLKDNLIEQYTTRDLKVLGKSRDWNQLSQETTRALLLKSCDRDPRHYSSSESEMEEESDESESD